MRFTLALRILLIVQAVLCFCRESPAEEHVAATLSRRDSGKLYQELYCPGEGADARWHGSILGGDAGAVTENYRNATLDRIRYFRIMAGVPAEVRFRSDWEEGCASAALMMSANDDLDHFPPRAWLHYTESGAEAARLSNLSYGHSGPAAITGQMEDAGEGNSSVGHRRWLLYPHTREMGFGAVLPERPFYSTAVVRVMKSSILDKTAAFERAVSWPPPGHVPSQLIFKRWSFSFPRADFSRARVYMQRNGKEIAVRINPQMHGIGDETLVWEAGNLRAAEGEVRFSVQIQDVKIGGVDKRYAYEVVAFNPDPEFSCGGGGSTERGPGVFSLRSIKLSNEQAFDYRLRIGIGGGR